MPPEDSWYVHLFVSCPLTTLIMAWFYILRKKIFSLLKLLYTTAKSKPLVARAILLSLCVAMTKGIIIFNEEFLVALTFVLFLDFSLFYFSETVKDSLDARSTEIKKELELSFLQRKQVLTGLIEQLKKESTFPDSILKFGELTTQTMRITAAPEIKDLLSAQIRKRLYKIRASRIKNLPSLQNHMADHLALATRFYLYETLVRSKK